MAQITVYLRYMTILIGWAQDIDHMHVIAFGRAQWG